MPESSRPALVIDPPEKNLGELTVRRALPDRRRRTVGPFIFFDHMGPAVFAPGSGMNVRAHPHIGLATVTYLFEGEILHRDSLGYVQRIRPGAVNWMTAGRGIVHSEKVTEEILASGQKLHGIQTWVALPKSHAEIEPSFVHYPADTIPDVRLDGANLRVIIGNAFGATSPVQATSETLFMQADLDKGVSLALPAAEELGIYVVDGAVEVGGQRIDAGQLAVIEDRGAAAAALEDSRLVLCGGDAIDGERIIWWNFVASDPARIERAKKDWLDGRFGTVPGETDFIPLPEN
jgi:redox-sensitive bicupin YhaK (pirin superfamily)